jgi:hypothetical protein
MARPHKTGLDYFPHDTDAVNDEKIESLRSIHGNDGYAFYFILLERIYRTNNQELDVSDAETVQILSRKIAITTEEFQKILLTALKYNCFDKKDYEKRCVLTSNGIKSRAKAVIDKRERMRKSYTERNSCVSDAEITQETMAESTQRKEKKRKVYSIGESKQKVKKTFIKPTIIEIQEYCKQRNNGIDAEYFFNYYEARGWILNTGKQMKNWQATIITWEKRNTNKTILSPQAPSRYQNIDDLMRKNNE